NAFLPASKSTRYTYEPILNRWQLGLVNKVEVKGNVGSNNLSSWTTLIDAGYGSNGELQSLSRMGAPAVTAAYETSATTNAVGTMRDFYDALGNPTHFSNYVSGMPEHFAFADGGVVDQNVNAFGEVTWRDDPDNHRTSYA